jgi:FAD dependent oxidoreductase
LPDPIHYIRFEGIDVERGIVTVNNSRVYGVDGTNAWDISRADTEARLQNRKLYAVIRKYIPGFENAFVIDSSPTVGVRETRRIRGPHVLAQDDMVAIGTRPKAAKARAATPCTAPARRISPGSKFLGASSRRTASKA